MIIPGHLRFGKRWTRRYKRIFESHISTRFSDYNPRWSKGSSSLVCNHLLTVFSTERSNPDWDSLTEYLVYTQVRTYGTDKGLVLSYGLCIKFELEKIYSLNRFQYIWIPSRDDILSNSVDFQRPIIPSDYRFDTSVPLRFGIIDLLCLQKEGCTETSTVHIYHPVTKEVFSRHRSLGKVEQLDEREPYGRSRPTVHEPGTILVSGVEWDCRPLSVFPPRVEGGNSSSGPSPCVLRMKTTVSCRSVVSRIL